MEEANSSAENNFLDMAGTVWEWCLNRFDHPDDTAFSVDDPRVLRGGSWNGNQDLARSANRNRNP